jgi:DNA repair exonuclease SbcCD ATPase subunit
MFPEKFRLMNEATEIEGGGVSESSVSYEASDDDQLIEPSFNDTVKDLGLDPLKYGLDASKDEEAPEEVESQGGEEVEGAGQATDESALLERLNTLGAVHNGAPIKVESLDELKNLVQMGKDYTLKTQSLSEERKAFETEKSSAEAELNQAIEEFNNQVATYQNQLQELEQWQFALNQMKETMPDIFEEVQRAYDGTVKQFKNPILDQQLAAIKAELAETKKGLAQREDKMIIDKFEQEKASLAATEQSLKELGVTIDLSQPRRRPQRNR